ncbi:MAG TPA: hypothetical protein VH309_03890 [Elusimicrobiota bacterium]|jgi:hypothetical protein|nr:hypothetical protein [Elusimicrobiota bacterium]
MSPRTTFLSRLLGLYFLLAALCLAVHGRGAADAASAFVQSPPAMLLGGALLLLAGLALVLSHNVWSGGSRAVAVTLIGWLTLIKGAGLLLFPAETVARFYLVSLRYDRHYGLVLVFSFVVGVWLTYGGFSSRARPPA